MIAHDHSAALLIACSNLLRLHAGEIQLSLHLSKGLGEMRLLKKMKYIFLGKLWKLLGFTAQWLKLAAVNSYMKSSVMKGLLMKFKLPAYINLFLCFILFQHGHVCLSLHAKLLSDATLDSPAVCRKTAAGWLDQCCCCGYILLWLLTSTFFDLFLLFSTTVANLTSHKCNN